MNGSNRVVVLAGWVTAIGLAAAACSSETARPPELGDCVKTGDASCGGLGGSSGGGAGPTEGGTGESGTISDAAGACGTAQTLLPTMNTACIPCIEGTSGTGSSCCEADLACSGVGACTQLLQCMVACASGDVTCANTCESMQPTGVTAYNDFAQCLASQCSPECPTLPQGGTADF